jgi:hypothetical protein
MIVCPRCGGRVNGDFYRHQYRYYRCAGHANAPQNGHDLRCTWAAPCGPIDTAVLAAVGELLEMLAVDACTLKEAWGELARPTDLGKVRAQRIAALERERAKAQNRLKDAALKLVDGELDKAGYELVRDTARSALAAADEEIRRLDAVPECELPSLDAVLAALPSWQGALASASIPLQHQLSPLTEPAHDGGWSQPRTGRARPADLKGGVSFLRAGARPATAEVVTFINDPKTRWGVEPICRVAQFAPATYYVATTRPPSARKLRDDDLKGAIGRVFHEHLGVYGADKVWAQLKRESMRVARCTVERLMRELGLRGVVRGPTPIKCCRVFAGDQVVNSEGPP